MKTPRPTAATGRDQGVRPAIKIAVWVICLACLGLVVAVHYSRVRSNQSGQGGQKELADTAQPANAKPAAASRPATPQRSPSSGATVPSQQTRAGGFAYHIGSTTATSELVKRLASLDLPGGVPTDEQAAAWKENLRQLIQQGVIAVPAIREFLEKNMDVNFGPDAAAILGYASLRMAMFDALTQIGSPVSEAVLDEVLQNTTKPQEIAQLAQDLEKLEPGVYQRDVLGAARSALALAAGGNLPNNADVAPLFQVLQQYGGADAVADLEGSANQWNYYATIALTQLPNGAGIPSLIQIAGGQQGNARTAALEMLAGVASQSKPAQDALMNLMRQNSISAYDWMTLTPFLAGNQMVFQSSAFDNGLSGVNPNDLTKTMVSSGNQSFYTAPLAALTPQQIAQQQALINQLLSATSDPSAIRALQQAKALLENRLGLLASSSGQ